MEQRRVDGTGLLSDSVPLVTQVFVFQSHLCFILSPKDVFNNLPGWAAALAAGAPRVQFRTSYAAWVEWVAPERKMPTEEYVASAGDYSLPGYSIVPSVFAW